MRNFLLPVPWLFGGLQLLGAGNKGLGNYASILTSHPASALKPCAVKASMEVIGPGEGWGGGVGRAGKGIVPYLL